MKNNTNKNKKKNNNNKPQSDVTKRLTKLQDAVNVLQTAKLRPPRDSGGFGSAVGTLARLAATGISKIVGMGDYTIEQNSLSEQMGKAGSAVSTVPAFSPMSNNRVRHRECLGVVKVPSTTGFNIIKKLRVNPTDVDTFPWLSAMGSNFTSYRVHGAALVYESNTSEYSATPYMGTICLGTRYDTRESDFSSMVEMQNAKFSVSAKPSQHILHPLECKPGFQQVDVWLCRRGNETATEYLYDKCNMYVATEGITAAAGTVLGRLWLTYDIELINPVLSPPNTVTQVLPSDCWHASYFTTSLKEIDVMFTTATRDASYTNPAMYSKYGAAVTDNTAVFSPTDNVLRFTKPGLYTVSFWAVGTGFSASPDVVCTLTPNGGGAATADRYFSSGTPTTFLGYQWVFRVTSASPTEYVSASWNDIPCTTMSGMQGTITCAAL